MNPTALWMEEFYLPEQSALDMQRMISNSGYSLNRAMSTQAQDMIGKERSLLLEQALSTQAALQTKRTQAMSTFATGTFTQHLY